MYTHWFSHMCRTLLLAYRRNQRIFIGRSKALLSWLAIRFSLRLFVSHQSPNYLTRKTVTISWQVEKIFLNVFWKKRRFYPFRENVVPASVILCSMLFLVIILWYQPFPLFVGWSVKNVFSHILADGEISSKVLWYGYRWNTRISLRTCK